LFNNCVTKGKIGRAIQINKRNHIIGSLLFELMFQSCMTIDFALRIFIVSTRNIVAYKKVCGNLQTYKHRKNHHRQIRLFKRNAIRSQSSHNIVNGDLTVVFQTLYTSGGQCSTAIHNLIMILSENFIYCRQGSYCIRMILVGVDKIPKSE